jgi:hypothetical protein
MRPEHWLYTIPLRLRSFFRWAQADRELDGAVFRSGYGSSALLQEKAQMLDGAFCVFAEVRRIHAEGTQPSAQRTSQWKKQDLLGR